MKVALYQFAHWYKDTKEISLQDVLSVPILGHIVPHNEAELIIIMYGGNSDHIPFLTYLLETHTNKKFIFIIGEYTRRSQAWLPKKIATKATVTPALQKIFVPMYSLAHIFFPYPKIIADKPLHDLLLKYKNNPRIYSILCENAPELGSNTTVYPIFTRLIIQHNITDTQLFEDTHTSQERYNALHKALIALRPSVYNTDTHSTRHIPCSTVFGNTTKERVVACNAISKSLPILIYGANPISTEGRLDSELMELYAQSQFVLCLENISAKGYITEKLFYVIASNAIPIYWGATDISSYCNTDALVICNTLQDIRHLSNTLRPTSDIIQEKQQYTYFSETHISFFISAYESMKQKLYQLLY